MRLVCSKRTFLWIAAAAVVLIIAAAFISFKPYLLLQDTDSGRLYAKWPVNNGSEFSIEFVHSVNQTPVRDIFVVSGNRVIPVETVFYGFGAGMQTGLDEGQTLTYNSDGSMSITGFTQELDRLNYIVGTVSDHNMVINGESISLRELCGKNAAVTIIIEERITLEFGKQ